MGCPWLHGMRRRDRNLRCDQNSMAFYCFSLQIYFRIIQHLPVLSRLHSMVKLISRLVPCSKLTIPIQFWNTFSSSTGPRAVKGGTGPWHHGEGCMERIHPNWTKSSWTFGLLHKWASYERNHFTRTGIILWNPESWLLGNTSKGPPMESWTRALHHFTIGTLCTSLRFRLLSIEPPWSQHMMSNCNGIGIAFALFKADLQLMALSPIFMYQ